MGLSLNLWQEVDKPKSLLLRFATNPKTPAKKLVGVFCFYFLTSISMERDFKGIRIPKEIRLDEDLNIMMKVLLVEIDSLDNEDWCFASNSYFSEFFWISETQISIYIKKLKELWYIEEVWFDWRKRYLKSRIKEKLKSDSKKTFGQPLRKVKGRVKEKLKHNNIDNNIDNNSIVNNTKSDDFENTNLSKDDFWEKKELSKEKKREDIDLLIQTLKNHCSINNISYDKTRDRQFWKHIMDWKEFWEFVQSIGQNRIEFALNILKASIKINYWKWICSWPMKIYQNYSDVYNRTLLESKKKQEKSKVAFIPWIYEDDKN